MDLAVIKAVMYNIYKQQQSFSPSWFCFSPGLVKKPLESFPSKFGRHSRRRRLSLQTCQKGLQIVLYSQPLKEILEQCAFVSFCSTYLEKSSPLSRIYLNTTPERVCKKKKKLKVWSLAEAGFWKRKSKSK